MTTFGTVDCFPSPRFTIPQSYIEGLIFQLQDQPYTWDGELLRVAVAVPIVYWYNIKFYHHMSFWNSNAYSLDHIVEETFYDVNGGVFHNAGHIHMTYGYRAPFKGASLFFDFLVLLGPDVGLTMPPPPPDFWQPKFLP